MKRSTDIRPVGAPLPPWPEGVADRGVAAALEPMIRALLGDDPPVRLAFWDGSSCGPAAAEATLRVTSPRAIRRLLWSPGQLALGRAYVAGELDIEGDVFAMLARLRDASPAGLRFGLRVLPPILRAARRVGALGWPPAPPPEEVRANRLGHGRRHSRARDVRAISHHYDVENRFYRIVLGPSMTYSCARFTDDGVSLEEAQEAKHELICRKLGLHTNRGARLLDVGCGWGSLAMHAATRHDARVVGITISAEQAAAARERVRGAGLEGQVEIRLEDYRAVTGETFDAVASVGMFEHVGASRAAQYFRRLYERLAPGGRLLNHAISSVGGSRPGRHSFMDRYVFPDGELHDVGAVVFGMERAGFEVRDVESLREHYIRTLRAWVANLEGRWDDAVSVVGLGRARVWRLYMAGCAISFEDGGLSVHQVLGTKPDGGGGSGMPLTRREWNETDSAGAGERSA